MAISLPLKIDNGKGIDYGQSCEERVEREDQLVHFLLAPKDMYAFKVPFMFDAGMQGKGAGLPSWHFNLLHILPVRKALGSLHYLLSAMSAVHTTTLPWCCYNQECRVYVFTSCNPNFN
jgi:hypothetical protein